MATQLRNDEKVLFIGDSITDCGRQDYASPLGDGYVKLFAALLAIREPEKSLAIINRGISGDRITDLRRRWRDDALAPGPDWLVVEIGINDLHSSLRDEQEDVSSRLFEEVYDELLASARVAQPRTHLLLIEPFYIVRPDKATAWEASVLALLPAYLAVVRKMAGKYDALRVQTHALFQRLARFQPPAVFCPEPVHPNPTGHLAIADAVYACLSRPGC